MYMLIKKSLRILNVILLAIAFLYLLITFVTQGPHAVLEVSFPTLAFSMTLFFLSFVEFTISAGPTYLVHRAPGARVMKLLRLVYSQGTMEEVFEPVHRDFMDEYAEALGDLILTDNVVVQQRARLAVTGVCCRYYMAFLRAVATQNVFATVLRRMFSFIVGK